MPRKILIVDDNAINRLMLVNTLQKDYDILEAEDGREALALMHRHYKMLSAVLLDIMMPEMDGYEVLRRVRENALLSQLPIIIVTGSEDEDSRVKALSLGANDFILKPFNPEIVKHCLKNNIALRETASILNAIQRDKLTGLFNREAFFEKVGGLIRDRAPGYYILSCFDIDNFKLINDQYGAAEGDGILKEIGRVVKSKMEELDGIAGRISADNFAALFPVSKKDSELLLRALYQRFDALEQRAIVLSIGRYVVTDQTLSASAIYDRAYLAKQSVKGRYDRHMAYFDERMLQKLIRDQQIAGDMEAALAACQFELWFQPQYNHVTGTLTSAEALVRWRHPRRGLIQPLEFIPLFEQNGFIYELDKYVWRETCHYLRRWLDTGCTPPPVAVNVSRYDIFRSDFIETLVAAVREFDLPIELLRLEITESAFAQSTKLIVDIVKQLIELGFVIEIDDFGSGYSSLNTLKSVPAQVIKLDMHFLEDGDDQRGGDILESIVHMAKWLGMLVIAEGVETSGQSDFLKSIGCSHVQGYLYAPPMPADDYARHFATAQREPAPPSGAAGPQLICGIREDVPTQHIAALREFSARQPGAPAFREMLPIALEKMMETSAELCYVKDGSLRYVSCSGAFAQAAGRTGRQDVVGKTDAELLGPALSEQYAAEDQAILRTGASVVDSLSVLPAAGGRRRYIRTSKYPLCNSRGEVIGICGIGRDVPRPRTAKAQQKR